MRDKLRILVVDDQHPVLLTYTLVLQHQGHQVTSAPTCDCALERLRQSSYDLVLCDFGMEGDCNGFDIIDFARQCHPGIAAIVLTGYSSSEISQQADKRGVSVLHKPVEVPDLLRTLHTVICTRGAA